MKFCRFGVVGMLVLLFGCGQRSASAGESAEADGKDIALPAPQVSEIAFLKILQKRESSRDFSSESLSLQTISNVLFAAFGINRPGSKKRTAPSAYDWQYIDVYTSNKDGLFRYDAQSPQLKWVKSGDIRALTGTQSFVQDAPLNLIYVFNKKKWGDRESRDKQSLYAAITVGAIVQNVYLIAAELGLKTIVRAAFDKEGLHRAMGLVATDEIIVAQTVGR